MKRSLVFGIAGALGMLFGLVFLILPKFGMGIYMVNLDEATTFVVRDYGFALLGLGVIGWMMRNADSLEDAVRAVVTGIFLFSILGLIVTIWTLVAVNVGIMHWVNLAIYLLLSICFGILFFKKAE